MRRTLITGTLALCSFLPLLATPSARAAQEMGAAEVLRRAEERFAAIQDYECLAVTENHRKTPPTRGSYKVWHKKPKMLRLRILRGDNRGSELAMDSRGVVRGRKGGILKAFAMRLSKKDSRLRTWRGTSALDMDWGSFYRNLRERAGRPGARLELHAASASEPYEIIAIYPENGRQYRDVYRIDPQTWHLLGMDTYVNGKLAEKLAFQDVKVNVGLDNDHFSF